MTAPRATANSSARLAATQTPRGTPRRHRRPCAPVRVYWYDDRIEIRNPGGAYGAVTAENVGRAGRSDYRNPTLADALRALAIVRRVGAGIPIARRALERNGSPPPEFTVESTQVSVTVWRASPPPLDDPRIDGSVDQGQRSRLAEGSGLDDLKARKPEIGGRGRARHDRPLEPEFGRLAQAQL